jgi:hypothetical protein
MPCPVSDTRRINQLPAGSGSAGPRIVAPLQPAFGRHGDRSAGRHGVASVDRQVEQHLFELPGVGAHGPDIIVQRDLEGYVLAEQGL